ncbi:MAG TPA: hypothetical protein VLG40_04030 [Candidatus Saccharimonas sp.]|nr:hypothetical protein [Candidatus Saccharimonas sp.]
MLIYLSATARDIEQDIDIYRRIRDVVRNLGHNLAGDWTETALLREQRANKKGQLEGIDWSIVQEAEALLQSSELVIAEASDRSTFGVGYEVAQALNGRKPILLLVKRESAQRSYVTGLKNDLITYKPYDSSNLERVVENFIKDNTIKNKDLRFNFVIDRQLHNHLRLKSFKTGKTKAEVVRDLLVRDMNKDK